MQASYFDFFVLSAEVRTNEQGGTFSLVRARPVHGLVMLTNGGERSGSFLTKNVLNGDLSDLTGRIVFGRVVKVEQPWQRLSPTGEVEASGEFSWRFEVHPTSGWAPVSKETVEQITGKRVTFAVEPSTATSPDAPQSSPSETTVVPF